MDKKQQIRSGRTSFVDLLIILTLATIPFSGIGFRGPFEGVDLIFPLDPVGYFWSTLEAWQNHSKGYFGWDGTLELSGAPYYVIPAFLTYAGLGVALVQRIWSIFVFALSGWSMYFFVRSLSVRPNNKLAALVASIFYMYNPFLAAYHLILGITTVYFVYATAPLVLALFARGLHEHKGSIKYPILVGLASITQVVGHIQTTILSTYLLLLYALFTIATEPKANLILRTLRFLALCAGFAFLFNSWWLLPTLSNLSNLYNQQSARQLKVLETVRAVGGSRLFDVLRAYQTYDPFQLAWFYNSALGILTGVVIAVIPCLALLLRPKCRWTLIFALGSVLFAMAALGSGSPFGGAYIWLGIHLPFGLAFVPANPWPFQFLLLLTYAPLVGLGVSELTYRVKKGFTVKKLRIPIDKMVALLLIGLIMINSWPLLTGNAAGHYSEFVVPSYYDEAKLWIDRQSGEFRVFLLPSPEFLFYVKYSWDGSKLHMVDFLPNFLSKSTIEHLPDEGRPQFQFTKLVMDSLEGTDSAGELLGLLGVRYVVLRRDMVRPTTLEPIDTVSLSEMLADQRDLKLIATFRDLQVYQNDYFIPIVNAASNVISVFGGFDVLIGLADLDFIDLRSSVIFFPDQMNAKASGNLIERSQLVIISEKDIAREVEEQVLESGAMIIYLLMYNHKLDQLNGSFSPILRRVILENGDYRVVLKSGHPDWAGFNPLLVVDGLPPVSPISIDNGSAVYDIYLQRGPHYFSFTGIQGLATTILYPKRQEYKNAVTRPPAVVVFEKVNSARYLVNVNASGPFFLVFNEVFSSKWKAFVALEEQPHYLANSYANAYYISRVGRYQVEVIFEPQMVFYFASLFSIAGISISTAYLLICNTKLEQQVRTNKPRTSRITSQMHWRIRKIRKILSEAG